jgi:hypothetical protein
LLDG